MLCRSWRERASERQPGLRGMGRVNVSDRAELPRRREAKESEGMWNTQEKQTNGKKERSKERKTEIC